MKLLVIDNYDSFTYNLVHLLAEITQQEPLVYRNDEVTWDAIAGEQPDAIVLSPGPGRPDRPDDFGVCRDAIEKSTVPLLGVCLGHQGIASLSGDAVVRAPSPMHGRVSLVEHDGSRLFEGIPSPFKAACYHSLIVQQPLPPSLEATAWSSDGLIMALAHRQRPQWGVQFHPESIMTDFGRKLLENFCRLANRATRKPTVALPSLRQMERRSTSTSSTRRAFWREIPREIDVEAAFCSLYAQSPYAFWLDSNLIEPGRGRWSYIGDNLGPNAASVEYSCLDKHIQIRTATAYQVQHRDIFGYLEDVQPERPITPPPCPFVGGHVGWLGYELRHDCGSTTQRRAATPDALFIYADRFIAIDHVDRKTYLVAIDQTDHSRRATEWLDATEAAIAKATCPLARDAPSTTTPVKIFLDRDKSTYLLDVTRCLDLIRQGETYQVCLTNELFCKSDIDPLTLYRTMRKLDPSHYAAFVKWPGGAVLSASPERFLSIDAEGNVETKPIKGTIKRDPDAIRDADLAEELRRSEKDRAENVMIVDLLRNDLSRNCVPGSVVVPKLFDVETYRTVHQLVSTVRGMLRPEQRAISLIRGAFPGGSMTGAPKTRTMEFIDDLEHRARGVYSGSLGWLGDDGAVDLNIVIRTIVATAGRLTIGVGGGIVAASTPEAEFQEMLLKAEGAIKSIVAASTGSFSPQNYQLIGAELEDSEPPQPLERVSGPDSC